MQMPKELWEEITFLFCEMRAVKIEWHFLIECTVYEDLWAQYEIILKADNMHHLFNEDKINQMDSFLVKIHRRRSDMEKYIQRV